ncbi:MAG: glycosyltransferase [Fimbriimonadaceae bacterium]|nr:glycosyltransferase [Chitinophagales bacterium]
MSDIHVNIISFNIPYPPDYGGLIDVFYKIKALHAAGIKIHLHCFEYGRNKYRELEVLCEEVIYYKRKPMWKGFFSDKPFIVSSRNNKKLKENLKANNYAIIFEGLHCCYYLDDPAFKYRKKIVRMHNDEAGYYLNLARNEKNILKKIYFYEEYRRLYKYEKVLQYADHILCISHQEAEEYKKKFKHADYLAPFHGNSKVTSVSGKGNYVLYHGNLSVNENEMAALFLTEDVFNDLPYSLFIAGKDPADSLIDEIKHPGVKLFTNPSVPELHELMQNAHLHILPAFTETGIKLKLLQSLFKGRFCIVNSAMVNNTGLEKYCFVADDAEQMKAAIHTTFEKEFSDTDLLFRKNIETEFSDTAEIQKLIALLR